MLQDNQHNRIRVVYINDKHPLIFSGLKTVLLNIDPSLKILSINFDDRKCRVFLDFIKQEETLFILDIFSLGNDFIEKLICLYPEFDPTKLVLFSEITDDRTIAMLRLLGVKNILKKSTEVKKIKQAFTYLLLIHDQTYQAVQNSVSVHKPEILMCLPQEQSKSFSKQEILCLKYLKTGVTNREISEKLGIAESTAKSHVSSIINKMNLLNRTAVVSEYYRLCLQAQNSR